MRRCAAGGAGLIISESTSPDHPSAYWQPMMGRMEPGTLGAWQQVVDAVHGEGAAFLLQIWHPGAMRKVAEGHPLANYPALSPSGLIQGGRDQRPRDDAAGSGGVEAAYVRAAEHAQSSARTAWKCTPRTAICSTSSCGPKRIGAKTNTAARTLAERARYSGGDRRGDSRGDGRALRHLVPLLAVQGSGLRRDRGSRPGGSCAACSRCCVLPAWTCSTSRRAASQAGMAGQRASGVQHRRVGADR